MITLIEALNYRCLRHISQPLGPFHVLVGPNASGKTTFLDVVSFLGTFVSEGLEAAIYERTQNFQDLVWRREGWGFELAIEALIPEEKRKLLKNNAFDTIRYELALKLDQSSSEILITAERGLLKEKKLIEEYQPGLFPTCTNPPDTILMSKRPQLTKNIFTKVLGSNNNYYAEVGKGYNPSFKFGPQESTLRNLPPDEAKFPVSLWLRDFLSQHVQRLMLNSELIKKASPPGQGLGFNMDGSNLPWVIQNLIQQADENYRDWISHLQTAFPDIMDIHIVERPDDKHRYLMICYKGGFELPSWVASDGTLRLLALTLPAYLPNLSGILLIEEPENGIHPRAIETMIQSLSSVYDAQILLATHSPVILGMVGADEVLCFAKTPKGATDIISGDKHPNLQDWKGDVNLGTLFASGVLS